MEAVRFTAKSKKLELVQMPIPKAAQSDDVLIKVAYSGICGTDLHIIQVNNKNITQIKCFKNCCSFVLGRVSM